MNWDTEGFAVKLAGSKNSNSVPAAGLEVAVPRARHKSGRPSKACGICGGPRRAGIRVRVFDAVRSKTVRVPACLNCKGVSVLDVEDRFQAPRSRVILDVGGSDARGRPSESQDGPVLVRTIGPLLEVRPRRGVACMMVGDCRSELDGLSGVNLFFTDPPYNIGYDYGGVDDDLPWHEYRDLIEAVMTKSYRSAAAGASFVMVHYPEVIKALWPVLTREWGFHQSIAWVYRDHRGGRKKWSRAWREVLWLAKGEPFFDPTVDRMPYRDAKSIAKGGPGAPQLDWWEFSQVKGGSFDHHGYGCQIPAPLISRVIRATTRLGDLVADPFAGTGSTAKVAVSLGRNAWGVDLNPEAAKHWGKIAEAPL